MPGGLGGLAGLLAALVVVFGVAVPDFASGGTLQSVMFQMPELGLLSLAMLLPLISGGLNLAIIATANQAALLMAWLMRILDAGRRLGRHRGARDRRGDAGRAAALRRHRAAHRRPGRLHRRASDPGHPRHALADRRHQHLSHPRHHHLRPAASIRRGRQRGGARRAGAVPGAHRRRPGLRPAAAPHGIRRRGVHGRLEHRGDALLGDRRPPRAGGRLSRLVRALLRRRLPDAGALQLGERRVRAILPAHHHPRGGAGRRRSVRRLRHGLPA